MAAYTRYGDTSGTLGGFHQAGAQSLSSRSLGYFPEQADLYGDAAALTLFARGGDDTLDGFAQAASVFGDAWSMSGFARGGNDALISYGSHSRIYGDAFTMQGFTVGGNDSLTGGSGIGARLLASNELYGDADTMSGFTRGGNDILIGAQQAYAATHDMYGDARVMSGLARGGDDTLIAARMHTEHMWGDAAEIHGAFVVTGHDTFVFPQYTGTDFIHDFEQGKDRIDLRAYADAGIHRFGDLQPLITTSGDGSVIAFGSHETGRFPGEIVIDAIHVLGVQTLTASDFLFV